MSPPRSRRALPREGVAVSLHRRQLLAVALLPALPAAATPETMTAAIQAHTGGRAVRDGRVEIEIAELVENGNTVPLTLRVQSPMTEAEHVRTLAVFAEKNPLPEVAVFHLGPQAGRAQVSTRIRLSTSQQLVVVATMSDGSLWQRRAEVIVTLAACIEG